MRVLIKKFISKTDSTKLDIFIKLINRNGRSIDELARIMDILPNTVYRGISELSSDFSSHDIPISIEKRNGQNYYLIGSEESYLKYYSSLNYFYGKKSTLFELCSLVITNSLTLTQICQELYISPAQVYRMIKKINIIIEEYQIKIEFNSESKLDFVGNELNIRIFLFNFLTNCIPQDIWFFKEFSRNDILNRISTLFNVSVMEDSILSNLLSFWGIVFHRINRKKYTKEIKEEFLPMLDFYYFLPHQEMKLRMFYNKNHSEKIVMSEIYNANFFLRIFLPEVVPEENNIRLGKELAKSNKSLVRFYMDMLDTWRSKYCLFLTDEKYFSFLNTAVLIFNLTIYIDINVLTIWSLDKIFFDDEEAIDQELLGAIRDTITDYILTNDQTDFDKQFFLDRQLIYLVCLMYIESQISMIPVLKIHISLLVDFRIKEFIKARIHSIYNKEVVTFISQKNGADIIIVDKYSNANFSGDCFVVSSFMSDYEWNNILIKVSEGILAKLYDA